MTKNWINFRFLHICPVEKCEISPNLAKIHISPHLLCGKTEIPLHVEKFHVLKSEISPHGRFLLHLHVGDRGDKYQVCRLASIATPVACLDRPASTWSVVPGKVEKCAPRDYFTSCHRCSPALCRCWLRPVGCSTWNSEPHVMIWTMLLMIPKSV